MALVSLRDVSLSFGGPALLEHVDLQIEQGERVGLVGRNGTGKSTLMKLICSAVAPDDGRIEYQQHIRTAYLPQDVPRDLTGTVFDVVAAALGPQGDLIARFHRLSARLAEGHGGADLGELERVQHELETSSGWQINRRVETVLSRLVLRPDTRFAELSGGLARRVMLARALVNDPHLLLLDEPTNHLDIDAIRWLEEFLLDFNATLLFVTHDRMLLRAVATRIIELDRGRLASYPGDYAGYLKRRDAVLAAEAGQRAAFDKKLAVEEDWVRQGIKARRTRSEGRVRALLEMRAVRRARRTAPGKARLRVQDHELSGRLVIEAAGVGCSRGDMAVIRDFSTTVLRGDKVGILGPNGAGKTTLLQVLLGHLRPDTGRVTLGTRLEIAYFDQHRAQLDEEKTVQENVSYGGDSITVNGKTRHVIGYLQDFLFSPQRAREPVRMLSGGERNRLLLARLFSRPSNLLVMDEPTNDLDVETLELLEELLMDYRGTLLLVSHDREFINNVVTSTLVFEGEGVINEYVGGYDDWLRQRRPPSRPAGAPPPVKRKEKTTAEAALPARFGAREKRELEQLVNRLEAMEAEKQALFLRMADPAFYKRDGEEIAAAAQRLQTLEQELAACYRRWEALESLRK